MAGKLLEHIKSLLIFGIFGLFLGFFAIEPAFSKNINSLIPNTGSIQRNTKNASDRAQLATESGKKEQNCEQLGNRIQNRITQFEQNREKHVARYNQVKTKLSQIVSKLKAKGYDTTQLESDITKFDTLAKTYAQEYAKFIDLLRQTLNYDCGNAGGQFRSTLQAARQQLAIARAARASVREFYKETIREDIKDLRNQNISGETESDESDE